MENTAKNSFCIIPHNIINKTNLGISCIKNFTLVTYLDQSLFGELLVDFRSVQYILCSMSIIKSAQRFLDDKHHKIKKQTNTTITEEIAKQTHYRSKMIFVLLTILISK